MVVNKFTHAEWLKENKNLIMDLRYLTKNVNPRAAKFYNDAVKSENKELVGYIYQEKGAALIKQTKFKQAAKYFELAHKNAIERSDMILYFYSIIGLVISYNFAGKIYKCLKTVMLGAATLKALLGDTSTPGFFFLLQMLETSWGKKQFEQLMDKFKKEYNLTITDEPSTTE